RLERRDVDDVRPVLQEAALRQPEEAVDRPEEGGERLARAGRRREQRVGSGRDGGPAGGLDRRRLAEAIPEPVRNERREIGHRRPRATGIIGQADSPRRVASSLAPRGSQRLYKGPCRPGPPRDAAPGAPPRAPPSVRPAPGPPARGLAPRPASAGCRSAPPSSGGRLSRCSSASRPSTSEGRSPGTSPSTSSAT